MKWIEMIRVTSSAAGAEEMKLYLEPQLHALQMTCKRLESSFLLQNAQYEGDLAIIMAWNDDSLPDKSRNGLLLAALVAKHGPVCHEIWTLATE